MSNDHPQCLITYVIINENIEISQILVDFFFVFDIESLQFFLGKLGLSFFLELLFQLSNIQTFSETAVIDVSDRFSIAVRSILLASNLPTNFLFSLRVILTSLLILFLFFFLRLNMLFNNSQYVKILFFCSFHLLHFNF